MYFKLGSREVPKFERNELKTFGRISVGNQGMINYREG
jgi:hypothetical protein